MGNFYTDVVYGWNQLLVSGYENGVKFHRKVDYKPYMFIPSSTGQYKTVAGVSVKRLDFSSIVEAREFIKRYSDVDNFNVYGLPNFPYTFIYDNYPGEIQFDPTLLRVGNVDIETDSQDGYGSYSQNQYPDREIISLTIKVHGEKRVHVLGLKPYRTETTELLEAVNNGLQIIYHQCKNERELLLEFIRIWQNLQLDVITNWNGEAFDMPYIILRIKMILTDKHAERLSPFKKIEKTNYISPWGRDMEKYSIVGIPCLDYMLLYKKFRGNEENYKLETIASKVLNLGKLDYSEFGTLAKLYAGNHNKFIDYNIIDVMRVEQIDDHYRLINQMIMMAYLAKCNYVDIFGTIRPWDVMIHNYLMDQKIVVPTGKSGIKEAQIVGGYVKDPKEGRYKHVMSFDLTSLYPHLIMQYNISPETLLGKFDPIAGEFAVDKILAGEMAPHYDDLVKHNVTVSGKGTVFSKDKIGFLPQLMKNLFVQRKAYKKKMLSEESLLQQIKQEIKRRSNG